MDKHDEMAMRDQAVPWPKTRKELSKYIKGLTEGEHDYGTRVYAMSMAATAAFQHVAHVLGVTGFQASMADLDILRRTRMMKGPFCIIRGEDMLYPQYDIHGKLREALREWEPWAAKEAKKKLAECGEVHPEVKAHWERRGVSDGGRLFRGDSHWHPTRHGDNRGRRHPEEEKGEEPMSETWKVICNAAKDGRCVDMGEECHHERPHHPFMVNEDCSRDAVPCYRTKETVKCIPVEETP